MKKNIWIYIAIFFIGFSAGILTGVVVDADQVYHTTIKKIRQKKGEGDIVIDVTTDTKTKKELRQEKRKEKRQSRRSNNQ